MTKDQIKEFLRKHMPPEKYSEEKLDLATERWIDLIANPPPPNPSPYAYDVDSWEILAEEQDKPYGERLTKFNCRSCELPLSEADLADIRMAHSVLKHYKCMELEWKKNKLTSVTSVTKLSPIRKFFSFLSKAKLKVKSFIDTMK